MRKYKLEITVFLCGVLGMILELVAARVLSPYVGSSNKIWTTIIGIMLISMSLGYWIGGKIADKKADINMLANCILVGAIFTSLVPIMEAIFIKTLTNITDNLILVAIIASAIIFGIPSFVISIISPFAVKIRTQEDEKSVGSISGRTSSISTIGSIVGTFFAGFYLIPAFGIRSIILGITIILMLLSIMLYKNKTKKYWVIIIIIGIILISLNGIGKIIFDKQNPDILADIDSEYSRIWVKEVGKYKTLQVENALESYINDETGEMGARYLYYYDLIEYYNKDFENTLVIGGAAYTYPTHYINKFKDKNIDVVEIDSMMTKIAKEEFGLNIYEKRLKIYHQDGRSFLNKSENKYDAILIDAFKGSNVPFELTTYESFLKCKDMLNDNGLVIVNIISSLEGKDSDFIKYEYSTFRSIFDDVKVFKVGDRNEDEKQNLILIGIKGELNIDKEKQSEYQDLLEREVKNFTSDKGIVTDNYAPIGI